ncbi:conserved hypothetical protein [Culex quinquefasciatus]|uniref:Uncharacterized protein n=1 Tax=Culex quinquefasciatus TaxID=7176 RepID=B0WFG3_CULQU|nr:conserved hypothetical protein [Culex quinquefasciatus]|eukprot:XP_001847447.1 conserved hypothetical protein [Culex quinquefasciatus]
MPEHKRFQSKQKTWRKSTRAGTQPVPIKTNPGGGPLAPEHKRLQSKQKNLAEVPSRRNATEQFLAEVSSRRNATGSNQYKSWRRSPRAGTQTVPKNNPGGGPLTPEHKRFQSKQKTWQKSTRAGTQPVPINTNPGGGPLAPEHNRFQSEQILAEVSSRRNATGSNKYKSWRRSPRAGTQPVPINTNPGGGPLAPERNRFQSIQILAEVSSRRNATGSNQYKSWRRSPRAGTQTVPKNNPGGGPLTPEHKRFQSKQKPGGGPLAPEHNRSTINCGTPGRIANVETWPPSGGIAPSRTTEIARLLRAKDEPERGRDTLTHAQARVAFQLSLPTASAVQSDALQFSVRYGLRNLAQKLRVMELNCKQQIAAGRSKGTVPSPRMDINVDTNPKIPFLAKGIKHSALFIYGLSLFDDNLAEVKRFCEANEGAELNRFELNYSNLDRRELFRILHNTEARRDPIGELNGYLEEKLISYGYFLVSQANPLMLPPCSQTTATFRIHFLVIPANIHTCDPNAQTAFESGRMKMVLLRPVPAGKPFVESFGPNWRSSNPEPRPPGMRCILDLDYRGLPAATRCSTGQMGFSNRCDDQDQALHKQRCTDVEVIVPTPDFSGWKASAHSEQDPRRLSFGHSAYMPEQVWYLVDQITSRTSSDPSQDTLIASHVVRVGHVQQVGLRKIKSSKLSRPDINDSYDRPSATTVARES